MLRAYKQPMRRSYLRLWAYQYQYEMEPPPTRCLSGNMHKKCNCYYYCKQVKMHCEEGLLFSLYVPAQGRYMPSKRH